MNLVPIELEFLLVNSSNDRHGKLHNEGAAIAWLFNNKEKHMIGLARDIVSSGELYETPLVIKSGVKYLVYDGNRRVTCMKLLNDASKAPTQELKELFISLRQKWKGEFPSTITCQIETDIQRVNEILFRRHTGSQGGVGQTTWDDRMKANFLDRTGKSAKDDIADVIENILRKEKSYLLKSFHVPR